MEQLTVKDLKAGDFVVLTYAPLGDCPFKRHYLIFKTESINRDSCVQLTMLEISKSYFVVTERHNSYKIRKISGCYEICR